MSHVNHMTYIYVWFVTLLSFLTILQSISLLYTQAFRGEGGGGLGHNASIIQSFSVFSVCEKITTLDDE